MLSFGLNANNICSGVVVGNLGEKVVFSQENARFSPFFLNISGTSGRRAEQLLWAVSSGSDAPASESFRSISSVVSEIFTFEASSLDFFLKNLNRFL